MKFTKQFIFLIIASAISSLSYAAGSVFVIEDVRFGQGANWYTEANHTPMTEKYLNNAASTNPRPTKKLYEILGDPQPGSWKTIQVKYRKLDRDKYLQGGYFKNEPSYLVSTDEGGSIDFSKGVPASEF